MSVPGKITAMSGEGLRPAAFTVLLGIVVILAGCIETDYLRLTQTPPPRITVKGPVIVLEAPPIRPFIKLAMVEASETGRGGGSTWEELRQALMERAEQLDADAIMDITPSSGMSGGMVGTSGAGLVGAVGSIKQLRAIAIRYTAP